VYFLSFHCISHVILFQLTTALFIDAFMRFDHKREREQQELEARAYGVLNVEPEPVKAEVSSI
jgi:hypothetical protein